MSMCKQILDVKIFTNNIAWVGKLWQNIYKIMNAIIPNEEYKSKQNVFKKRAANSHLQIFYNYINSTEIKEFFTCLKDQHEKERYSDLGNIEIRNALLKLRLPSYKLSIVTGKWFKMKQEEPICKFCDLEEVEDEISFFNLEVIRISGCA